MKPFQSGLQIMGTLASRGTDLSKFALPQIQAALECGIFPAAMEAQTLVMDVGVPSTLSKMVGRAYVQAKQQMVDSDLDSPRCQLVGVTPLSATSITKEQIKAVKLGESLEWSASLERGHDNFVFLDYTRELGEDNIFWLDVQHELKEEKVPSAVVLIRGGDEEKESMVHLVRMGIPIVVLEGTGGFADEIATLRLSMHEKTFKKKSWALVRSTIIKDTNKVAKLVQLLRLKDEVTKFICLYPKLHIVPLSEGSGRLKSLMLRLLKKK